ncbi:MAG: carbon storage regulator CsrA [Armatimonadota bacterium]
MLVLTRKVGQALIVGESVEITVLEVRGESVRLGIAAPRSVSVLRKEVRDQVRAENLQAAASAAQADEVLGALEIPQRTDESRE